MNEITNSTSPYTPFKGRSIDPAKKVRLYRNLNNGKISIKQGSLVVGHAEIIAVQHARFIVQEKNRQKVLAQRQKNVHAFVEGLWFVGSIPEYGEDIWYNPYLSEYFRSKESNEARHEASLVQVESNGSILMWN